MNIDKLKLELPSQLADMCRFSFDCSNLMKVIEYLFDNNLVMIREIKVLKAKVFDLEILQSEFEKVKSKANLMEKSNENMNLSFLNMKEKFIQNESKVNDIVKNTESFGQNFEKFMKLIEGHDTNLNNLNKVVEENVKNIKKNHEDIINGLDRINKQEQEMKEIHVENIKTHEIIKSNETQSLFNFNKAVKDIETINSHINDIDESINSMKILMDKKNRDFDNCINNIMDNISELSSKGVKKEIKVDEANDNNLFKIAMGEIERTNEKINTYDSEHKMILEKKEKEIEIIKKLIEGIQTDINNINNKFVDLNTIQTISNEEENADKKKSDADKSNTKKTLEKLDETMKKIMKNIASLPSREEYDTSQRNILIKLKKLEDTRMSMVHLESRVNKPESNKEKTEINMNYFNTTFAENLRNSLFSDLNSSFREMIKKEGKNLDLSKNSQILEILKIITRHNDDINNNNKSVIDLRRTLIALDVDKKVNILSEKINSLEEDADRNKKKILELNLTVNGNPDKEDSEENEENYDPQSLKGKIEITEKLFNTMSEKITAIEGKYKSLTREIKDEIKSNLKVESIKTVNQFREKLELFSRRFEEELRNKIDQMGLNHFEQKMNTKLYYDLKDKLNRNEMQKNNNLINRKIDSLENKISKTLVDTIIDLQMDEAPLIVKRAPNNLEICASCNQVITKEKDNKSVMTTEQMSQSHLNNNKSLNINKFVSNSSSNKFRKTFYGFNKTQTSMPKINNVMSLKKELPDINKYS